MGGQNPYIEDANVRLPTRKYRITFVDEKGKEHVVEVDPAKIPYEDHGLPGSLPEIAMAHGIEIDMNTAEAWANLKTVGDIVVAVRQLIADKG